MMNKYGFSLNGTKSKFFIYSKSVNDALKALTDSWHVDEIEESLNEGERSSVIIRVWNTNDEDDNGWTEVEIMHPLYLTPCSNCGSDGKYLERISVDGTLEYKVSCTKCAMSTIWYDSKYSKYNAAKVWNTGINEVVL